MADDVANGNPELALLSLDAELPRDRPGNRVVLAGKPSDEQIMLRNPLTDGLDHLPLVERDVVYVVVRVAVGTEAFLIDFRRPLLGLTRLPLVTEDELIVVAFETKTESSDASKKFRYPNFRHRLR